jgi:hypothetical protein
MMTLALMRTAIGMEDPELPLLQRIHSLELQASEIATQGEETVCIRPSLSSCCKETTTKGLQ